jgi:Carboxypeptidase regulatory-like domain
MPPGILATLVLLAATQAAQPPPPRDPVPRAAARPQTSGGSAIRGRVTDRETGQPLARVNLRLGLLAPPATQRNTLTDGDGRFDFSSLPAGRYSLVAEPAEGTATHLPQRFGQRSPLDPTRSQASTSIELKEGETREADMTLWKALAIEGRVFGEHGEPLANVQVSAVPPGAPGMMGRWMRSTDDRGAFRVFGLRPGEYHVCADPRPSLSSMRNPNVEPERPLKTCYPGTLNDHESQAIVVSAADVGGVDIRLRRGRVYTITGIVLDSSGAPMTGGNVSLVKSEGGGTSSTGVELKEGQFVARSIPPGDYAIRAEIGSPGNWQDKREREVGYVRVRVDNADVEGVVVQTAKGVKVSGRIEFDDGVPAAGVRGVRVNARQEPGTGIFMGAPQQGATVDENLTFQLEGLFGPHLLQVFGQPRGLIVKAIKYRGEDIFGRAVEFKPSTDPGDLVVVLTNRGALLTGRVDASADEPADARMVLLLPTDPARRNVIPGNMMSVPVGSDGTFRLPLVRAGEYLILALAPEDMPNLMMAGTSAYERFAKVAEKIVLSENEERSVELRPIRPK